MKYFTLAWLLLLAGGQGFAQSDSKDSTRGLLLHFSAVGALKYPGARIGADYLVISKQVDKKKRDGRHKVIYRNRLITANLGFYYHRDYNANIFLHAGYQLLRVNSHGWFRSFEPQIGISRTFVDGTVYKVDNKGGVTKKKAAGDFFFAPAISASFGKDLSVKNPALPLSVFIKATFFTNMPYNNFVYARGMAEIGAGYRFDKLFNHSVKYKQRLK